MGQALVEWAIRAGLAGAWEDAWPLERLGNVPLDNTESTHPARAGSGTQPETRSDPQDGGRTVIWLLARPDEARRALDADPHRAARRLLFTPLSGFWDDPIGSLPDLADPLEGEASPADWLGPHGREETLDWLGLFWAMIQRAEEYQPSAAFDAHGRFPAWASRLYRRGWLDRPVADEIALRIARGLRTLANQSVDIDPTAAIRADTHPNHATSGPPWTLALTHDVDSIRFWSWRRLGSIVLKREPDPEYAIADDAHIPEERGTPPHHHVKRMLWAPWIRTLRASVDSRTDPHWTFPWLRRWEAGRGVRPTIFVLPERRTGYEPYDLRRGESPRGYARGLVTQLQRWTQEGAEIALHPPYDAPEHPERLASQVRGLEKIAGTRIRAARYHWLRLRVSNGWQVLADAGIEADSSLGHSQREGFRAGTAHPFLAIDLESGRATGILEVPLTAMDSTLRHHRDLLPSEAIAQLNRLLHACRRVGGVFCLLWHTNSFDRYEWRGWRRVFNRTVEEALGNGAQSRTISEIAHAHREARRILIQRLFPEGLD
jgi:hypothetical protein